MGAHKYYIIGVCKDSQGHTPNAMGAVAGQLLFMAVQADGSSRWVTKVTQATVFSSRSEAKKTLKCHKINISNNTCWLRDRTMVPAEALKGFA